MTAARKIETEANEHGWAPLAALVVFLNVVSFVSISESRSPIKLQIANQRNGANEGFMQMSPDSASLINGACLQRGSQNSFHFFHSLTKGSKQSAISLFYISSQNPSAFYWEGAKKKIKKSLSYSLLSYSVPGEELESKSKKPISEPRGWGLKQG